ncbi:hypothetical protein [Limnobacter sp.]|uniref:hypothetical protein n=1 Tax=Limnobacter sp. TaxID=2003368 RepID=UPI0025C46953|nr:hypothetical protein [Limnobacter sp.]
MKEQENNPLIGAARRCANFAMGDSAHASNMRSTLLAIDNPAKWPLNLNAIKELPYREKKDLFFVLTCFVAVLETMRLRDLLQDGKEIFQRFEEAERHAILSGATDQVTWSTGYWKEDGKEAMRFRFGSEIVETFDDEILIRHLETAKA